MGAAEEANRLNEENARLRDEIDKVLRERDLALGRLENEIKAANQARMAEERARESLDELDEAIYDCLPWGDDESPLDCVEHAADRLRDLAQERDEWRDKYYALDQTAGELCDACGWRFKIPGEPCRCEVVRERDELRADLREFVRQAEDAYALLKPLEEGSDVVERAVSHLLTVLRGRERPGPWAFDAVLRERDEVRAEVATLADALDDIRHQRDRYHVELKQERAEVERLKREVSDARIALKAQEHRDQWLMAQSVGYGFYKRGAEAMREACAKWMSEREGIAQWVYDDALSALPIPEDK